MPRVDIVPVEDLPTRLIKYNIRTVAWVARNVNPRVEVDFDFRLGKGHCIFFADKGLWLIKRHAALFAALQERGERVAVAQIAENDLRMTWFPEAMQDWMPDEAALRVNRARLVENV